MTLALWLRKEYEFKVFWNFIAEEKAFPLDLPLGKMISLTLSSFYFSHIIDSSNMDHVIPIWIINRLYMQHMLTGG